MPLDTPTRAGWRLVAREAAQTLLLMLFLFVTVRAVVQNFRVEGPSMQPTLSTGEFLWVNKAAYVELNHAFPLGGPQRGDIAVLHSPDPTDDVNLIKRIIGLPGDRLLVNNGKVYVNGFQLTEPYIRFSANYTYPADGQAILVPDDQYFVLGDNRSNSRDSHLGWFVPTQNLIGRAVLSYWPPADWGVLPGVAYAGI